MEIKRLTKIGMLVAMASAIHLLESVFSPLIPALPGAKLGLANAFTLFALMHMRPKDALVIGVLRCLVGLLISGAVMGFVYAISGALASFIGMFVFKHLRFSVYAISVMGALFHNTAQLGVAILLTNTLALLVYWPWLLLFAIPTGLLIGALDNMSFRVIEKGTNCGS